MPPRQRHAPKPTESNDRNGHRRNQLHIVDVVDAESAQKMNFQGSPSILVDGIDIYSELKPEKYSYSCRVYEFDRRQTGVIPREFIRGKLEGYQNVNIPAQTVPLIPD